MLNKLKTTYKRIKRAILKPLYLARLKKDVEAFEKNKTTNSNTAYQNMINAFCATGGSSNSMASHLVSSYYPVSDLEPLKSGSLFDLTDINFSQIDQSLRKDGYYILPQKLPLSYVDELYEFAGKARCKLRAMDGASLSAEIVEPIDFNQLKSILYSIPEEDLINLPTIQKIVSDYLFLNIGQNYLNCDPVLDVTSLWWSTNFSKKSDKNAAQWFHFDMDRIRWLKIFIYLTDVNSENGPHTFIKGSSKDGGIPLSLLAKGYYRLDDAEVETAYSKDQYVEFKGEKGTIIIEDTRGLHKGKNVIGSPRCLLQFQLSNSLFGSNYPKVTIQKKFEQFTLKLNAVSPRILSHYL